MSIWLLPTLVVVLGLVPVAVAAIQAADEVGKLRRQLGELAQLRPALVELRSAGETLRASMRGAGRA